MFFEFQDFVGTVLKDDAVPNVFDAQPENQALKRSKDMVGKKKKKNLSWFNHVE